MVKFVNTFCDVVKKICYYVCYASMAMVAVMMCLMFADALLGLFFNTRIRGSYELVQCMLCVLVFTSWAYTQTQKGHIHVVMFIRLMPKYARFVCFSITSLLSTAVMGLATYGVFRMFLDKMANNERTAILLIPYWPLYVIECIAFAVMTIALLADTLKAVTAIFNDEVAEDVMSSWT